MTPRSAARHNGESELRNGGAHFAGQLVTRVAFFHPCRPENGHAWTDEMEDAKSAEEIQ
jgi:hypothetical protein